MANLTFILKIFFTRVFDFYSYSTYCWLFTNLFLQAHSLTRRSRRGSNQGLETGSGRPGAGIPNSRSTPALSTIEPVKPVEPEPLSNSVSIKWSFPNSNSIKKDSLTAVWKLCWICVETVSKLCRNCVETVWNLDYNGLYFRYLWVFDLRFSLKFDL